MVSLHDHRTSEERESDEITFGRDPAVPLSKNVHLLKWVDKMARLTQPGALDAAVNWYRAARSGEPVSAGDIEVPTLYVWGDADASVGRVAAEATVEHVKAPYRFEAIAGGAHALTDQLGERVTQFVLSHVEAC